MNDITKIINENEVRNKQKHTPYNPISGLGCVGDRFELSIIEYPYKFYFPIELKENEKVKLLIKHKSTSKALESQFKRKPTKEEEDAFWLMICDDRYEYDFEFYAVATIKIEDKDTAKMVRFVLNRSQRYILSRFEEKRKQGLAFLFNILKARQMGASTLIQMYMEWIQNVHQTGWNSVVCAHTRDAAINIRSMYQRSITSKPPIKGAKLDIKNFEGTLNIKEIPQRRCRITVGFASDPESVRSQNPKMAHFSEVAFYPHTEQNKPELLEASIISTAGNSPYNLIVRESTANGIGGYFYEQYIKGKRGETAYESIFTPWFMIPLYEIPFNGYYYLTGKRKKGTIEDFIKTLTDYEKNLFKNNEECTLENLNWRRFKAATMPSERLMKQEFPSDDIEAFQDSGSPVFNYEDVEALRDNCIPPIAVGKMSSLVSPEVAILDIKKRKSVLKEVRFIEDERVLNAVLDNHKTGEIKAGINYLHVWEYPDVETQIKDRYIVVFDPQKGTSASADYGVIKVIDRYWMMYGEKPEVVALFYGRIDKDITLWIAAQIATWYNNALLVVESNTYDTDTKEDETEFIFNIIADNYNNLYYRAQPAEKVKEGAPIKYGFHTNKNTKPAIISNYIAIIRERAYIERDNETLNEARMYETKPDGTTGAKDGQHDDRIMSTMIGLYVCYNIPIPTKITKQKTIQPNFISRTAY